MKYKHIATGGTFDLLHSGHKQFINYAFSLSDKVTIGITTDKFVTSKKDDIYQDFEERFKSVRDFLVRNNFLKRSRIVKLNNFFGPTISDSSVEAILVTRESETGAKEINRLRSQGGLKELNIEIFLQVLGFDEKTISSTRIRQGLINSSGLNYFDFLKSRGDLYLPSRLRSSLREPFGQVYKNVSAIKHPRQDCSLVVTVGDYTTRLFLKNNLQPTLAVIDFKIQRNQLFQKVEDLGFQNKTKITKAVNPPGVITLELVKSIHLAFRSSNASSKIILVEGEEDLAVLPAGLLSPLGGVIYYGLRNVGLVEMRVDLDLKEKLIKMLNIFSNKKLEKA